MKLGVTMGKLFTVCEWIMRLSLVNLLWIFFSLIGLVLFGIMPASVALCTIVRKWLMKETDIPIWSTFFAVYREEFKKSNVLGSCIVLCGMFLIFDFLYVRTVEGAIQFALLVPLFMITVFYLIILIFILPVYVHYELKLVDYIKNALFIGVLNFHITLFMAAGVIAVVFIHLYIPGLALFFGAISVGVIVMFGGIYSFKRIERRQVKYKRIHN